MQTVTCLCGNLARVRPSPNGQTVVLCEFCGRLEMDSGDRAVERWDRQRDERMADIIANAVIRASRFVSFGRRKNLKAGLDVVVSELRGTIPIDKTI